jgi:hypothetical protein
MKYQIIILAQLRSDAATCRTGVEQLTLLKIIAAIADGRAATGVMRESSSVRLI